MHQHHQLRSYLGPDCVSQITGNVRRGLGGRLGQVVSQVAPQMPDPALVLDPGQPLAQKSDDTLGAITYLDALGV
jgi:hypothetical protein